jgi:hypothetical protein
MLLLGMTPFIQSTVVVDFIPVSFVPVILRTRTVFKHGLLNSFMNDT